ncbi:SRPBCC domain-containing protein [Microbacterium panaciterrae]|uniref:SRPBCC family protein n=1 Tax=Microbacterium panaciterrae TaxID=985759 RepID=A0ABP8PIU0_9MICO
MAENHVATATITIDATPERVWAVITDPEAAKEFMVGTTMRSDWRVGSPITWQGTWQGRDYEDEGTILEVEPGRRLVYTHFSPLTGDPDVPENYHTLTWTITGDRPVVLELSQDNNKTAEGAAHSQRMWDGLVVAVKGIAERGV